MKKALLVITIMLALAIAVGGCATKGDLEAVEAREMAIAAKADQAAQDAEEAKMAADEAIMKANEAIERAVEAEMRANEREALAADKERLAEEKAKEADEKSGQAVAARSAAKDGRLLARRQLSVGRANLFARQPAPERTSEERTHQTSPARSLGNVTRIKPSLRASQSGHRSG